MTRVIAFLVEHGAMLATGATVLLLLGTLATLLARAPLHRQRIGEMSVLATLAWLVLACLPLPRVGFHRAADRPTQSVGAIGVPSEAELTVSEIPAELIARPQKTVVVSPPEDRRKPVDLRPWVAWAFLGGAGLSLGWLILGHVALWRLIRGAAPAAARARGMIGEGARILVCGRLSRPVTCGVFRPIILLPAALLEERCAVQLRQVLLHERGHVEQRDGLGSLLFSLALPGLYFHPLYWWLRRSCALARELVVDDRAARADGKAAYVTHLIALARGSRTAMSISPVGAIGILQIRSHFYRRMTMLLQRNESLATRCSNRVRAGMILIGALAVISSACVLGVRPARAQEAGGTGERKTPQTLDQSNPGARQSVDVQAGAADERRRDAEQAIGEMTAAQVGMVDPTMRQMLKEREAISQEMARLRAAGTLPENAKMKQLQALLEGQEKKIDDYLTKWREVQLQLGGRGVLVGRLGDVFDPNQARATANDAKLQQLIGQRDTMLDKLAALNAAGAQPNDAQVTQLKNMLDDVQLLIAQRMSELRLMEEKRGGPGGGAVRGGGAPGPRPDDAGNNVRGAPQATFPGVGGVQLDLVNLGNSMVDASGALRLAKVRFARLAGMKDTVSQLELAEADSNLITAEKRLKLLRGIAKVALSGASEELNRTRKLYETGMANGQSLAEMSAKVQMLELILQSAD
jgi:hypothetical protein